MARGGARPGAGRKKGSVTRASAEARRKAIEGGQTPLDYMLTVMRNANAPQTRRDDMAKAAAPYVHSRFSSIPPGPGGDQADLSKLSDKELDELERISRKIAASYGDPGGAKPA